MLNIGATIVLGLLLLNALVQRFFRKRKGCGCESECGCCNADGCGSHADTKVFSVGGMSCNHCRTNVEKAIAQLPGVESVAVDLQSATATVKGRVSDEDVRRAVESIGFRVC